MAARSGAGTGVIVSLVIFVLSTVFLLVMAIVFYSGKTEAELAQKDAQEKLAKYVKEPEQQDAQIEAKQRAAEQRRRSLVGQLMADNDELLTFVNGSTATNLAGLRSMLDGEGLDSGTPLMTHVRNLAAEKRQMESDLQNLRDNLSEANEQIDALNQKAEDAQRAYDQALAAANDQIEQLQDSAEEHTQRVTKAMADFEDDVRTLRDRFELEVEEKEDEIDDQNERIAQLMTSLQAAKEQLAQRTILPTDPDLLVDGEVLEAGSGSEVFINRGKQHRMVLGMRFEVYDDAGALARVNRETGMLPRGKATLQVIKIGAATSTCKIIRSIPGRPVVREDVIANAIYDPNYTFKFMVHGKFDVNGDGRATVEEADYLRSLVLEWGGVSITGNSVPGDLDFLVLGVTPPPPANLPPNPTDAVIANWERLHRERALYTDLFTEARNARIPVISANRFLILTGFGQ